MNKYILGLDLGTSSVKLVLTDVSGQVVMSVKEGYPMLGEDENRYEQNPADWIAAIKKALEKIGEGFDLSLVSAIGLSGQMPSLVLTNRETGEAVGNSILWCDSRADAIGADLLAKWGEERYYSKTGIVLDGRYLIPMYLWLKDNGLADDYNILSAKDYICYWLSGELVTDPSTASGYAVYSLKTSSWDEELLAEAGVDLELLPSIRESSEVVGNIKKTVAHDWGINPNAKIVNGGADSVCGVIGLGATEAGTICQMWGTSTAIIGIIDNPDLTKMQKYFITPMSVPKSYGVEADLISTGVSFEWMTNIIGGDLVERVKNVPVGSDGLLFYPYLSGGEQGVLWDPDLRGGVLGMTSKHNLTHMAHALMEGMCFEVRRCIEAFDMENLDIEINEIMCTGFASHEPYFMQMMADILGKPCTSVRDPHGSALGAAFLAGIATDLWIFKDTPALAGNKKNVYEPNEKVSLIYEDIYEKYVSNTSKMKNL